MTIQMNNVKMAVVTREGKVEKILIETGPTNSLHMSVYQVEMGKNLNVEDAAEVSGAGHLVEISQVLKVMRQVEAIYKEQAKLKTELKRQIRKGGSDS